MATESRITPGLDGPVTSTPPAAGAAAEPSLGELFRDLAQDSSTLLRQEVALARAEMRESVQALARDAVKLAVGGGVLLVGLLVLTAFLVALVGDLLGDEYWLGALIVGLLYAVVGGVLLMSGKKGLQHDDLRPDETLATLREDKRWARTEVENLKRDLRS